MRADARASRDQLVAAAWQLYSLRGGETSLRSIAVEAGVGIGTLYRHFPSEKDLLEALVEEIRHRVLTVVDRAHDHWEADPDAAWQAFVRELAGLRLGALLPRLLEAFGGPDQLDHLPHGAGEARAEGLAAVGRVVGRAKEAGLVEPDLDPLAFHVGLAVLTRPMPDKTERLLPDAHAWLVDVYTRGLRP